MLEAKMVLELKQCYGQRTKELNEVEEELREAEDDLIACEDRMDEIEMDICSLKKKRDQLKKDWSLQDLSVALSTPLKQRGYKLTEVLMKFPHPQRQLPLIPYTEPAEIFRFTVLENNIGDIVKQWESPVSIAEILGVE
jgi:septal ring factor EnvC (AmiA/AmiB activator)